MLRKRLGDRGILIYLTILISFVVGSSLFQSCTSSQAVHDTSPKSVSAATPVSRGQRTYHIGNSLTDTINDLLGAIAQSAGYNHEYLRSTIPGSPTDWSWDHPGTAQGEKDYRAVFETKAPLDHLFTQPFAPHGRSVDEEVDYSGRFYRLALQKSPNVQHWIYAQWPTQTFEDSWAQAKDRFVELGLKPAKTWDDAVQNHVVYHEVVRQQMDDQNDGKPILIVPGGLAMLRLKQEIAAGRVPGIKDFFSTQFEDDIHLTNKGGYLIALVHYACIYKRNPAGVTFANTGLTAEQAAIYQRIAWDTVRSYQWSGVGN
ncbi:MAG: hypothetical protein HC866_11285 [Leptolyngbyaceae cyanobacterium RU_5_1]|nr:hypothetical protein [Leptolyngbyaceae cyanobacterium RU_5_1]